MFHGCNRTQCKAWQKKKYQARTKRGMNWTCPMNKLFLYQSNGMKCYRIMKIIPQAFHRVQDHQNRNLEWKVMPKLRCAEIGHRMIRRSHFCEHRMNSWEEENKCIRTGWSGGTIGWLCRFILCFFRKHTERYSRMTLNKRSNAQDFSRIL
jgi:hypothetical protein